MSSPATSVIKRCRINVQIFRMNRMCFQRHSVDNSLFLVRYETTILVIKPNAPLTIVVMMLPEYRSSPLDKTKRTFSATYWTFPNCRDTTTGTMKRCEKHTNLLRIKPNATFNAGHLISKMPRCIQQKLLYFFAFKKLDLGDECE